MTAPVLMVQGTGSSVGKSTITAGLCRLFARRGLRVLPFKAQNMSNNAAVCAGGGEIGRAQYVQALAARAEPTVDMNPILLKPQAGGCQVVVRGQVWGVQTAAQYFGDARPDLWPVVTAALDHLRASADLVVAEGAGSPAEINLRDRDLVNMRVARYANADVLLVADIDRGGAFAAALGTWEWLEPAERALLRGFVLNKFRGDVALLAPAPALLQARTGVPVLGVVPFMADLRLPEEDAVSLAPSSSPESLIEIAVVHLPHLSNFDEFASLGHDPRVSLRYVTRPQELRAPDLVILPGTKATIPDLLWLHDRGLAQRIRWLAVHGTPVLGICGGYQMLGADVTDPQHHESDREWARGLELLPVTTVITQDKRLEQIAGVVRAQGNGFWNALANCPVSGYEMHQGHTTPDTQRPFLQLAGSPDGAVSTDGLVAGTYLHGLLEATQPREAVLHALAAQRGFTWQATLETRTDPLDALADVLETTLDLSRVPIPARLPGYKSFRGV